MSVSLNGSISAACTYALNDADIKGAICSMAPTQEFANKCYCNDMDVQSVQVYCAGDSTSESYLGFMKSIQAFCAAANSPVPTGGTLLSLPSGMAFVAATATSSVTSAMVTATAIPTKTVPSSHVFAGATVGTSVRLGMVVVAILVLL
ncbi:hypothetical protein HDU98_006947 [Podochytrium sp. JEL0797]|nr:hypothetical protein HDU98_006942 [Podochytrium sp. JEL0797]KAJ3070016.1 hypothetical protein HDU98_006947 [Podochytrium sp. JEL0797]